MRYHLYAIDYNEFSFGPPVCTVHDLLFAFNDLDGLKAKLRNEHTKNKDFFLQDAIGSSSFGFGVGECDYFDKAQLIDIIGTQLNA